MIWPEEPEELARCAHYVLTKDVEEAGGSLYGWAKSIRGGLVLPGVYASGRGNDEVTCLVAPLGAFTASKWHTPDRYDETFCKPAIARAGFVTDYLYFPIYTRFLIEVCPAQPV